MIKKKKMIVYLLIILLITKITYVNAWTGSIGFSDKAEGGDTTGTGEKEISLGSTEKDGTTTNYTCVYNYDITVKNSITINGYNQNDNSIMEDSINIQKKDSIISGTAIGIEIYETKTVEWTVTKAIAKEQKTENVTLCYCRYSNIAPPNNGNNCVAGNRICKMSSLSSSGIQPIKLACSSNNYGPTEYRCQNIAGCNYTRTNCKSSTKTTDPVETANTEMQTKCKEVAEKSAIAAANGYIYPSYKVELPDSNKKDGDSNTTIQATLTSCSKSGCKFSYEAGKISDNITAKYDYKPKKVCINVKNAQVRYIESNSNCITGEEIEVKNGTNHWHYFTPLSLTSNDEAGINLMPSGQGKLNQSQCKYVMENNTNYKDLIIKIDYTDFKGNHSREDYNAINNGCYLTSKIKIPVKQKFYNEEKNNNNQIIFKGFNFYYRAIDINNPFPNGIAADSYWYQWGQSQKVNQNPSPDLSESFATKTYETKNISASAVREYNEEHPYTSWDEMNTNGSSSLINSNKISNTLIERIVNNKDYYNLGCGPANKDWEECR